MSTEAKIAEYYEDNFNKLVNKIKNRVGGVPEAEDVVQEAFTRALTYAKAYNGKKPIGAWMSTILNNATRDSKREARLRGMSVEIEEDTLGTIEIDDVDVESLWAGKPEQQAEILRLHFRMGFKPTEISEILDLKTGQIYMTIRRFIKEYEE